MTRILILLSFLYFLLLIVNINSIYVYVGEEARYQESTLALFDGFIDTNNHPLLAKTIWLIFIWISYGIFGVDEPVFWRIGTIVLSILSLLVFYKISRLFFSKKVSILATTILALDPMYFVFSRLVQLEVPALFFTLASLYFFLIYLKGSKIKNLLLGSSLLGLSLAVKFTALLVAVAAPAFVLYPYLKHFEVKKFIVRTLLYFALLAIGFTLGNFIFFIFNHSFIEFVNYIVSLLTSQLNSQLLAYDNQSTPPETWFFIPQILTMFRLNWNESVEAIFVLQNPLFFLVSAFTVLVCAILLIQNKVTQRSEFGLILLFFVAQYLPWFFRLHTPFYYYILPLIPLIILLFVKLTLLTKYSKLILGFTLVLSLFVFIIFYPLLVGLKTPKSYEMFLYNYSRYEFSEINTIFCQNCYPRK